MSRAWFATLLAACLWLATPAAWAGRSCETRPQSAAELRQALELAQRTAETLDASGATVVVLARAGQDLSRWRLRWSHMAWAYRDAGSNGAWRIVHKLNQCGSDRSALYRQGLAEFFLDDPYEYRAAFAVPTTDVQAALRPLLADNGRIATLHVPAYNLVAYPWSQHYQQSNQWVVETLAMAVSPDADNRARAQAWLRLKAYRPTELHIGTMERLGARLGAANVSFDDHPSSQRFSGRIETVTADSVFEWLQQSKIAGPMQELR